MYAHTEPAATLAHKFSLIVSSKCTIKSFPFMSIGFISACLLTDDIFLTKANRFLKIEYVKMSLYFLKFCGKIQFNIIFSVHLNKS